MSIAIRCLCPPALAGHRARCVAWSSARAADHTPGSPRRAYLSLFMSPSKSSANPEALIQETGGANNHVGLSSEPGHHRTLSVCRPWQIPGRLVHPFTVLWHRMLWYVSESSASQALPLERWEALPPASMFIQQPAPAGSSTTDRPSETRTLDASSLPSWAIVTIPVPSASARGVNIDPRRSDGGTRTWWQAAAGPLSGWIAQPGLAPQGSGVRVASGLSCPSTMAFRLVCSGCTATTGMNFRVIPVPRRLMADRSRSWAGRENVMEFRSTPPNAS